mmetsp:Transcript_74925/g.231687  ORF Transcript_74925/g.231687 Transcript_74925/m.231687 type:complete len:224 (-) Transcript_74925:2273-2944(-)
MLSWAGPEAALPIWGQRLLSSPMLFNSCAGFNPESLASSASIALRWSPATTLVKDSRKLLAFKRGLSGTSACCLASASSASAKSALILASTPVALRQASSIRAWNCSNASVKRCVNASISATGDHTGCSACKACTTNLGFMPLGLASSERISPNFAAATTAPSSLLRMPPVARSGSDLPLFSSMDSVSSAAVATRSSASALPAAPSATLATNGASTAPRTSSS